MTGQADGTIVINTTINTDGVGEGGKEILTALKSLAGKIESLSSAIKECFANMHTDRAAGEIEQVSYNAKQAGEDVERIRESAGDAKKGIDDLKEATQEAGTAAQNAADKYKQMEVVITDTNVQTDVPSTDEWDRSVDGQYQAYDTAEIEAFVDKYVSGMERAVDSTMNLEAQAESLKNRLKELKAQGFGIGTDDYDEAYIAWKQADQALKEYKKDLDSVATGTGEELDSEKESVYSLEMQVESLKNKMAELKSQGLGLGDGGEYDEAYLGWKQADLQLKTYKSDLDKTAAKMNSQKSGISIINALKTALKGLSTVAKGAAKAMGKLPLRAVQSGLRGIATLAKKATTALAGLAKSKIRSSIQKLGSSLFGVGKGAGSANSGFQNGLRTILRYGLGIQTLFTLVNKLRSALVDGFNNLVQYSDEVNSSISSVKTSLTTLKNSLATAFAPIVNVVAPYITKLIDMLSEAASYLSMFFSALQGKSTYTKAVAVAEDYAASLSDSADAATDAANATDEAAEAAERYLAPMDKINQIGDSSSSSSSDSDSTSTNTATGPYFEEVEVGDAFNFDSWGEAFDSFLDYLLNSGIPALRNGLSNLAGWINTFSSSLYETLTFPGVLEKVQALGQELASALNDFVNWVDWTTIGAALGAGLNLALNFLVSFIYTFDWMNLGASLAESVNAAIKEIDWYAVGQLLWAKFKIAIETLAGFLLNLDMAEVAKAASNIIIGFFQSMTETIQSIDWYQLGQQIKTFLVNIDWAGVAEAVFTAIGAAIGALASFLWGLIGDAVAAIKEYFLQHIQEKTGELSEDARLREVAKAIVSGILEGIVEALKNIGTWIYEHIVQPFVEGFKSAFKIGSPSKVMEEQGGYLVDGVINAVTSLPAKLLSILSEALRNVIEWGSNLAANARTAASNAVSSVLTWFSQLPGSILTHLNQAISNVLSFGANLVSNLRTAASNAVSGFISFITQLPSQVMSSLGNVVSQVIGWGSNLVTQFRNIGANVISGIISGITGMVSNLYSSITNALSGLVNRAKSALGIASPSKVFRKVIGWMIPRGVAAGVDDTADEAVSSVAAMTSGVQDEAEDALGTIDVEPELSIGEKAMQVVRDFFETLGEEIQSGVDSVTEKFSSLNAAVSLMQTVQFPQMADGTIVPAKAGKYSDSGQDPETGGSYDYASMKKAMKEAFVEAMASNKNSGSLHVTLNIDGREWFSKWLELYQAAKDSTGVDPIFGI